MTNSTELVRRDMDEATGRHLVSSGELKLFRERLGFTRKVMAEFLHTTIKNYSRWERDPETKLWATTSQRIGRFHRMALAALDALEQDGISIEGLVPFHVVTREIAMPHELLLRAYRQGTIEAVDMGILGPWIDRKQLTKLRKMAA